jgi:predicted RNA-binding protein YlxR (DUF448 family)
LIGSSLAGHQKVPKIIKKNLNQASNELFKSMKPNYRRCISCRKVAQKEAFWRVVRIYPHGEIQLDRGMGRSAYICPTTECVQRACYKHRLAKILKAQVPESIYQRLQQRLTIESTSN